MQKTSALLLVLLLSASSIHAEPTARKTMVMQDVTTNDQMAKGHQEASLVDPLRQLGEPIGKTGEDPAKGLHNRDLIKESTVICYRGSLTLVPKRAVLFVPDALVSRIGVQPDAKVLTWADFRNANRGWIRTVEVTREQAFGNEPIAEEIVAAYTKSTSIVVATFKDGPISVLPLKLPEPGEVTAQGADAPETTAAKP